MSNVILTWAKRAKAGGPSAKVVLMTLADEASTHGECWTTQSTLAEETEQSVDSVQRRLRDLERRGLIYMVRQRHWQDSGKWRSNMIVVLADAICVSFALKHGYDPSGMVAPAENGGDSGARNVCAEIQDDSGATVPQTAGDADAGCNDYRELGGGVGAGDAADCGTVESGDLEGHRTASGCGTDRTALVRYENPNLRTRIPPYPRSSSEGVALEDDGWLSEWERLTALWPAGQTGALDKARARFRVMEPSERGVVLRAAANYVADVVRRRAPVMMLRNFLRSGQFREWENRVAAESTFVRLGSEAWRAWLAHKGVRSMPTTRRMIEGKPVEGWEFPTLFPPARG